MATDLTAFSYREMVPLDQNPAAVYLASLSESGRRTMRSKLERAANVLGYNDPFATPWGDLRFQHVAALRTRMVETELAPSTINATLSAVRGVARAAFNLGVLSGDDLERIRNVKLVPGTRLPTGRALDAGEIAALLAACTAGGGAGGARDAALIGLMYAAGLRRAEVVTLDLEDLDLDAGELRVRGKGNRERKLYVMGGAADALADWIEWRGDAPGPLFQPVHRGGRITPRRLGDQAVYNVLRKRAEQARVKRFSPHDLRRTFVTDLLDEVDVVVVQQLAGHAMVQTTAQYDRRGEETKRRAAGRLKVPYQRHSQPEPGSQDSEEESHDRREAE